MNVPLCIGQTMANGVSIDWGDGSTAETLAGTGIVSTSHTYSTPGDYIISLMPHDGCTLSFGNGESYCVMGPTDSIYCNMLKRVAVGDNVTYIRKNNFASCYIASITIPAGVTLIDYDAFNRCYLLASITFPDTVTSLRGGVFSTCYNLASIAIPHEVTTIEGAAFYNCHSIVRITIPDGVTTIGGEAFYHCYAMRYYDFSACTKVPALGNTNTFNGISSDCQMLIPAALFDEWRAATNWATFASYMVAV